ncbi:DUF418 domain-containing protein [Hyphobacterium sp. HN65]|uniref:DUF418 domain-containing protein n=1 Tax=Hyphobacterium lacteum TaxID=3116575 RepID=A0ABU7LQQ2_9PROT|nr:DUF418 domain-containing protein [Hyphobacterium sp. HN65]MEE2526250.1 DUF418 domain-containing protein [Hyphobacterium sp. HN65]
MNAAPKAERHTSIDTLRGFAVLGILIMNIQGFAMVMQAYSNPLAHMDFSGANQDVWFFSHVFFAMKAMTIFSTLFGAGIILMLGDEKQARIGVHYRRMIWLLVIGLIHAWIFWWGDILVPYAVMGMLVVFARRMSATGLMIFGLALIAIAGALMTLGMMFIPMMEEEQLQAMLLPTPEMVSETVALYQQGFLARLGENMATTAEAEVMQVTFFAPRLAGAMLVGMALFKMGFLTLRWSVTQYAISAILALGIGIPLTWWSSMHHIETGFALDQIWIGESANYFLSPIVAFGYASVVMLMCKFGLFRMLLHPFTAAGRMAFTNYLTQTLIMTYIFVGSPGLGLIGTVERVDQLKIVIAVWIAQLIISPLWLSVFRFGPLEWVWRSLTYWKFQPMRKTAPVSAEPSPPGG